MCNHDIRLCHEYDKHSYFEEEMYAQHKVTKLEINKRGKFCVRTLTTCTRIHRLFCYGTQAC